MSQSLTSATVHGLKWSYLSTFVNVVLQIGVTAVLARLLTPSAFGLVAMAGVFLRFGQYFAQMGAGQAIVQKPELSASDIRTAFTSSLLIGVAFCALFVALAPLASALFPDTPGIVSVARVMSLTFVIGGLTGVTQGLLRRRFAFRAIALIEIGSYVLGYAVVGLVLAFAGFGAWSLVAASLGAGALSAAAYTILCRCDVGFGFDPSSFKAIFSFGGRVSLIGFAEFVSANLDTLWTGHYLGAQATGLYTRATNIATVPLYSFTSGLSRVLLPGYSRIQAERERLKAVYLTGATVAATIAMPVAWGLAGAAHEVVLTLLGSSWLSAVPVLAILAAAVPFTLLAMISASLCEATATLNMKIVITVGDIGLLGGLIIGLSRFGIVGIAGAFALSQFVVHVAYLLVMDRLLAVRLGEVWRAYSLGLAAGAVTGLALLGLHLGLGHLGWPAPVVLMVQFAVGTVCLVGTLARGRKGAVWHDVRSRLVAAGYRADRRGVVGRIMRGMDTLG